MPFDQQGVVKTALCHMWAKAKFRKADDFVFATRNGTPTERRNVPRHLKAAAKALKHEKEIDFRGFRTMHASLMRAQRCPCRSDARQHGSFRMSDQRWRSILEVSIHSL